MADYIKRDAVVPAIDDQLELSPGDWLFIDRAIESIPAADVYTEEDVRNAYTDGYSTGMAQGMEKAVVHGNWLKSEDNGCEMHKCSVCGARVTKGLYEYKNPNKYCYHCGAKMNLKEG